MLGEILMPNTSIIMEPWGGKSETYKFKTSICQEMMHSYNALINEIADYKFNFHRETLYGAKQNATNKQILLELSLLKPVLQAVLENIDFYFSEIHDNQLINELEKLINLLEITFDKLAEAKEKYYKTWWSAKKHLYYQEDWATDRDLGKAKLNWKLARNNACHIILKFYEEINKINLTLQSDIVHTIHEVDVLYNNALQNIIKGPNYYTYLSPEERKNMDKENIARKRTLKNN